MPDETGGAREPDWLIQPPSPGEVRLYIAIDEGAEISPEARAALDQLVELLQKEEVEGYATGTLVKKPACPTRYSCGSDGSCRPLVIQPCFMLATGCHRFN